jgi:secreted Zn-dependent insulinase-like peptidase
LDEAADNPEGARISMSLVESINTAQTEYNQCVSRQQKLLNDLKEKRSDKLKKQIQENASILNLVQLWKNEDERLKLLKLAEMQKAALKNEVDRLTTMEDIKCKIMGLTNEEAING